MELYLKAQNTILADLRARVRDGSSERWTDAECYGAINDALLSWQDRVRVPHVYTVSGGWVAGTYEYVLPDWIRSNAIQPQFKAPTTYETFSMLLRLSAETWQDIPGWRIEPNASNQRVLQFTVSPYSTEGRIIWWGSNMPVPATVPTTSGSTAADATSIVLGSVADCHEYGWVKIGNEWIQYAGVTRGATTTTLTNCVRGQPQGADAGVINTGTSVYFGVAMPKLELYRVLLDQAIVHLHELYLGNAASKENQLHQEMVGFYGGRVANFWKNWSDTRTIRQTIDMSPWMM